MRKLESFFENNFKFKKVFHHGVESTLTLEEYRKLDLIPIVDFIHNINLSLYPSNEETQQIFYDFMKEHKSLLDLASEFNTVVINDKLSNNNDYLLNLVSEIEMMTGYTIKTFECEYGNVVLTPSCKIRPKSRLCKLRINPSGISIQVFKDC